MKKQANNLWGGRFTGKADQKFVEFNRSFGFDLRLFAADIRGSQAHCAALAAAGVLTEKEAAKIQKALHKMLETAASDDSFFDDAAAEDVHSFIESKLVELIGDAGRKLHTGRSRNDQVATALRLWLRDRLDELRGDLSEAQTALVELAEKYSAAVLPGYTHLQRAQPVLLAHWCLAYFEMLERDAERMA